MHGVRCLTWALALSAGLFLGAWPLPAQQSMAAINGRIADASGAAIPGARVTAVNQEQGVRFTATSNADGIYNLPRVPTGRYTVSAAARGFQTARQGPFTLILGQTAQINLKLSVGAQSQTVSVTAQAPLLQTENTETSINLNSRTNSALPLLDRNYVQLTTLAPGAVVTSPFDGTALPAVNGNRAQGNNFILGGMDNNKIAENEQGYTPTPDALAQFNLITSNASAEYGNFQGGIITASIKSGTNQWHGDAWEYVRNNKLNANPWEHNWEGVPRPQVRWNDFGATIGGPVLHNKLFVFADYDGNRNETPNDTAPMTELTAAEQQGDFSALLQQKTPVQLYDPTPATLVNGVRQAYQDNQIPLSEESPVAKALFANPKLYPAPINAQLVDNQLNTSHTANNTNQGDVRVDWNLDSTNHMYVRGSMERNPVTKTDTFPLILPTSSLNHDYNVVADWTHTIGGSFVNDARVGFNYVGNDSTTGDNGLGDIAQSIGITDGNDRGPGLMEQDFRQGGATTLGSIGSGGRAGQTVIEYEDNLIITHNRNMIHTGFEGLRYRENIFYGGNDGVWGIMEYNGQFTGAASNSKEPGADTADFFLGLPSELGRGTGTGVFGQRRNVLGAYVEDDWRATDSLTLNLGLRYENFRPMYEIFDRELNVLPVAGTLEYAGSAEAQQAYGSGVASRALYKPTNGRADFQPRLGFAWSIAPDMVVRGAYGISTFMEGTGSNLRLTINPPFEAEYLNNYTGLSYPSSTTQEGMTTLSEPNDLFHNVTLRLWSPDLQPAVTEQWNLSVQRQLSNSTTVQLGYLGEHGTHLVTAKQLLDSVLPQDCSAHGGNILGVPCSTSALSPSPYLSGNSSLAGDLSNVSATYSDGIHIYHSLQAVLQRRFAGGLQYQASYTWSKCMSDSGGFYGTGGQGSSAGEIYAQDTYNMRLEYGPCFDDVTNMLSSYAIYALPVGAGKTFDLGRVGNAALGHWNLSATWNLHGGFAMSPSGHNNTGNGDSECCRLDCNGPVVYTNTPNPQGGIQWFSPDSFSEDSPGAYPTCGRGVLRGPGLNEFNLSVQRSFPITESKRVQIRADFNNLTNSPLFEAPDLSLGSKLGRITSAGEPRQIELAVKFYY